jgi:hypothetical protein
MEKEPLYRAQRFASEEAFKQAADNFFRRLLFRPVLKTSHEREIEVLAEYGYGPEHALKKPRKGRWPLCPKCRRCQSYIAGKDGLCEQCRAQPRRRSV